jgi:acyl-CoA thioesterase-1
MFFGDSFVAGVGDPAGIGWVGRVVAECNASGRPITAYNLGIRGETSVQLTLRLAAETLPRLHPGADCRVVIAAGTSDTAIEGTAQRVPSADSLAALERALAHATALDVGAFVLGPPPAGDAAHDKRIKALSAGFSRACATRGVPYLDLYMPLHARPAWAEGLAANDGVHPSAGGYELLASTVIAGGLIRWLEAPTTT